MRTVIRMVAAQPASPRSEASFPMCQPDPDRPPPPNLGAFLANQRNTGLPWYRLLAISAANNWRKLRTGRNCCGNHGQPGC